LTSNSSTEPGPASTEVTFRPLPLTSATLDLVVFGYLFALRTLLVTLAHRFHLSLPAAGVVLSVYFVGAFFGVPIGWLSMRRSRAPPYCPARSDHRARRVRGRALDPLGDVPRVGVLSRTRIRRRRLLPYFPPRSNADEWPRSSPQRHQRRLRTRRRDRSAPPRRRSSPQLRLLYVAIAISVVLLTLGNRGLIAPPLTVEHRRSELVVNRTKRRSILATFIAAYIFYVATETTTAGWIAPHLHRIGYSASLGSIDTAGFWLGLAFGRVLAGPVSRRHSIIVSSSEV